MVELARKLWSGAMPRPSVVEKLLDRADGVPFVLEQIALSEAVGDTVKENALPDFVQSVIHARLNHLSAKAKAFAQALSILGEEVDVDLASRTLGIEKATLLRRRSELERVSIVHPLIANSIRFRHAIVAEACAETVPGARRQRDSPCGDGGDPLDRRWRQAATNASPFTRKAHATTNGRWNICGSRP